jgi:hypothetical protein
VNGIIIWARKTTKVHGLMKRAFFYVRSDLNWIWLMNVHLTFAHNGCTIIYVRCILKRVFEQWCIWAVTMILPIQSAGESNTRWCCCSCRLGTDVLSTLLSALLNWMSAWTLAHSRGCIWAVTVILPIQYAGDLILGVDDEDFMYVFTIFCSTFWAFDFSM